MSGCHRCVGNVFEVMLPETSDSSILCRQTATSETLHKVAHMWMHWPKLDMRYHLKYSNSCKLCGCKFVYACLWLAWCMLLRCCILQRAHSNRSSDAVPLAWLNYTLDYIKCKCKDGWADCKDSHLPCCMGFHSFHTRTVRVESMSQTHLVQLHTHLA